MRRFLSLTLIATIAALILSQQSTSAYTSIRVNQATDAGFGRIVRWDMSANRTNQANGRILYKIGAAGTDNTITGPFNEFSAIQRAFGVWAAIPDLDIDFEFDGTVATPVENGNDDVNTIYFATGEFGPGELAVTTTTFDISNGQILDADLALNDDVIWDTYAEGTARGTSGRSSIRHTAVHEIGHFLGLDHSFLGRATLFPFTDEGAVSGIALSEDDIAGLVSSHDNASAINPRTTGSVSGNVSLGGTGQLGVQVSLIDIATGRPLLSALSDRDTATTTAGNYRIDNVPSGNYWVTASPILTGDVGSYFSSNETLTDFVPEIHGVGNNMTGEPTVLRVGENEDMTNIDFTLMASASLFEANETVATASTISRGEALAARIETTTDLDHYSFIAMQNEVVTIRVTADGLGSDCNPFLVLYGTDGTTKLVSGDFNDSSEAFYSDAARDRQADGFVQAVLDFDAELTFTAPAGGTYTVMVDGTSFTTGFYFLHHTSNLTQLAVDANATRLIADRPSVEASGTVQIAVEPRTIAGVLAPNAASLTVELFDITGGGNVSVGLYNGAGPWTFNVTAPAATGTRRYRGEINSVPMDQILELDVYGALDGPASIVQSNRLSLPADGASETTIRIAVNDAAGNRISDPALVVTVTASAGNLRNGAATSASASAALNTTTGLWEVVYLAPSSGTTAMISASVGATDLGATVITLTEAASAPVNPGTGASSDGGGGGGCALVGKSSSQTAILLVLLALLALVGLLRKTRSA